MIDNRGNPLPDGHPLKGGATIVVGMTGLAPPKREPVTPAQPKKY